ncbi:SusD/RagB family nutrient-binding outer membrane lipoprotein [Flavobacterium rhizosphaerae]|uniref:SusD/RagB family nutrient-binding outer membrane lipoprotein n=1 Tax=Flavobacterium rhizosphaerae TaxID=3163298 RepID=A0ABW8YZQ6_9FLAO
MKKFIMAIAGVVMFAGCSNFEEINTNPNTPTQVSASMLTTNIILSIAKYQGQDSKAYITENALPKYVGYANEGQLSEQYNLIRTSSFGKLTILPDIDKMLAFAEGSPAEESYKGVAHFIRAYTFYLTTMDMGDIPYSEAGQGAAGNFKPKYDTQKEVFLGILTELEEAAQHFQQGTTFVGDPTPFAGNPEKWLRAVNAFELKVLMTLSNKTNDADLRVQQRFSTIVNNNMLFENDTDYFGLVYNTINAHPLYSTNDMFTGRTLVSNVVIDNLKALNDKRLYYFAEPAPAQITAGYAEGDMQAYNGVNPAIDYATMNANYGAGKYSKINLRYQVKQDSETRRMLSYAEQEFILAEARIRGWISTGSAEQYYQNGVKSALKYVMNTDATYAHGNAITQSDIDNYFTGEAAFADNAQGQLEQIWMQRYLLNFLMDGKTSYYEYRRVYYPEFPVDPATNLNVNNPNDLPMRYLYPTSELNYNSTNLMEALNRQFGGYDEINQIMWLLAN